MTNPSWYYVVQGQRQGPVSEESLRQMLAGRQIDGQVVVWREGMADWMPAQLVRELWGGSAPPPLPLGYHAPGPYAAGAPVGESAGVRMLIPVGRSGWAIAAGYLGLFSVLMVFGPFAIFCSIMAIRSIRNDKTKHGMGRAIFGLVMGVLGTIGLVSMGVAMLGK